MLRGSSYIPGIIALGTLLIAAGVLTITRPRLRAGADRGRLTVLAALAIGAQTLHFLEEWRTGFAVQFPAAFGSPSIPDAVFIGFNVGWITIWMLSIGGFRAGITIAAFPLWFLGLAAVANMIAHPLLAARAGGYFPGLLSSPLLGILGAFLLSELKNATAPT